MRFGRRGSDLEYPRRRLLQPESLRGPYLESNANPGTFVVHTILDSFLNGPRTGLYN